MAPCGGPVQPRHPAATGSGSGMRRAGTGVSKGREPARSRAPVCTRGRCALRRSTSESAPRKTTRRFARRQGPGRSGSGRLAVCPPAQSTRAARHHPTRKDTNTAASLSSEGRGGGWRQQSPGFLAARRSARRRIPAEARDRACRQSLRTEPKTRIT